MKNESLLRSWKEIASYLGRDRRTCLRWEKNLGLPIRRLEEGHRGGVFAYKEELDRWLRDKAGGGESGVNGGKASAPAKAFAAVRHWVLEHLLVFHVLVALIGFGVFLSFNIRPVSRRVRNFHIEGSVLTILNDQGRELWKFDTNLKNLAPEALYRAHFQRKVLGELDSPIYPYISFRDIQGDGRTEVLFSTQTTDEFGEGTLYCFDDHGKELWYFQAGRALRFGRQPYSADFRIYGFDFADLNNDGKLEILVMANHKPDWPCQLTLLDGSGKTLGEFWNSGYFNDLLYEDLNGDGRRELIAGGVNNEYGEGCIAVFDPAAISGCSPQQGEAFRCDDLRPGSEKYYILLPRTDVDLLEYPVEGVNAAFKLHGEELSFEMLLSRLFFEFDYTLQTRRVRSSHNFQDKHMKAVQAGKVKSALDEAYYDRLLKMVRYWDGEAKTWTARYAMANKW